MHFFAILASLGVVSALPTLSIRGKPEASLSNTTIFQTFTDKEAHANVMRHLPAEKVVTSTTLGDYASNHHSRFVYVSDLQVFVDVSTLPAESSHSKRQSQFPVTSYSIQNPSWQYTSWTPASGCTSTGFDPDGGNEAIQWSKSVEASISAGLNFEDIASGLSASVGFSLTQTFSVSETTTCNIPGNSVGQIWEQTKTAHADVYSQTCWYFNGAFVGCDASQYYGGITAPSDANDWSDIKGPPYNKGCSAGADNTSC